MNSIVPKIFITSVHRSGSTHIGQCLCNLYGRNLNSAMIAMAEGFGADEHMIHPFMAQTLFLLPENFVFHMHVKGTTINVGLLKRYDYAPIITTRNIFDVLLSVKERQDSGLYVPGVPSPPHWMEFTEEQKWEWLGFNVATWNIQFAASWLLAEIPALVVRYEDHYADQVKGMQRILDFFGGEFSREEIRKACDINVNKKVGKVGRGQAEVPASVRKHVEREVDSWGDLTPGIRKMLL